jgi:hypothetical protein
MIAEKLSKTVVERIKAADQDVVVWDKTLPGFGVRVKPSGVRTYSSFSGSAFARRSIPST